VCCSPGKRYILETSCIHKTKIAPVYRNTVSSERASEQSLLINALVPVLPLFFEVSGSGLGCEQEAEERAKRAAGETRGREKGREARRRIQGCAPFLRFTL